MDTTLNVDLNKIVSQQVRAEIEDLRKQISDNDKVIASQKLEIKKLTSDVEKNSLSVWLIDKIRSSYSEIKETGKSGKNNYRSKSENQFLFIEQLMLFLFGTKKEAKGWYCYRSNGNLKTHLAINYYSNKKTLINLLKIIKEPVDDSFFYNGNSEVSFIESFIMPQDYEIERVLDYVNNPKYNTNECIFGISNFWIERGASYENMPHDLIMKSDHIVDPSVFKNLIETIKKKKPNYYYLYALPKYNERIKNAQIKKLGETLLDLDSKVLYYDVVSEFINNNILKFNKKTLDELFKLAQNSNHYSLFFWQSFPVEYQSKYLMSMGISDVLKTFSDHSCKWTDEEKETFLSDYSNRKNN